MSEDHERIARAISDHGEQLGGNLAFLKRFLQVEREAQQAFMREEREAQQAFLAEQRKASDRAQGRSEVIAWLATAATLFAAIGTGIQAYVAWGDRTAPIATKAAPAPLKGAEGG